MSVNYSTPVITSRLQVAENAIDAGAGPGVLRILDSGGNVLSSVTLADPAASVSGTVMTFNNASLIDPSAAAGGTASAARIDDSNGNIVISGLTVGSVGTTADLVLSPDNVIIAGQTIIIQQATITGV